MIVNLQHKEAFRQVLATYQPSTETVTLLEQIPLVILQGITASGRNTIIDKLVSQGKYWQIVSDTTRPPKLRDGAMEQHGVQYFFRSEEDILLDLQRGKFLEAELIHDQQVSGISIRELQKAHDSGMISINEVAREGVENIRKLKPNTIFMFIVPPSYEIWMQRLTSREYMSHEELRNRMQSAVLEITEALQASYFHFITNDNLDRAVRDVDAIAHGETDESHAQQARNTAKTVLDEIRRSLGTH
jgi:guanylate kinase